MTDSENVSVDFFRNLVKKEKECLNDHCVRWRATVDSQVPSEVEGDILVAIGQAELLKRERFSQFSNLIDDCEFKRGEKETTCQDLQGFWDIVYFQVVDVNKKFKNLSELKKNNWKAPEPKPIATLKRVPVVKPVTSKYAPKLLPKTGSSAMRAHILAARQKLKNSSGPTPQIILPNEAIANKENRPILTPKRTISAPKGIRSPEKAVFDAGFFKVVTPVKKLGSNFGNLGKAAGLRERALKTPVVHKDYSPCIRVTRSMKSRGLGTKLSFDK